MFFQSSPVASPLTQRPPSEIGFSVARKEVENDDSAPEFGHPRERKADLALSNGNGARGARLRARTENS